MKARGKAGVRTRGQPVVIRRFDAPDESREFEKGRFEAVTIGPVTVGRARYEPGWKWSEHVAPIAGTRSCEIEHVGLVVSGRAQVKMEDGAEVTLTPGDLFFVPAGHDSWVVGDEPYVSLHLQGAAQYATAHRPRRVRPRRTARSRGASRMTLKRRKGRRSR